VDEALDRLDERLARKLAGQDPHHVWRSLAAMLQNLRRQHIDTAVASVEFLKSLLDVARQSSRPNELSTTVNWTRLRCSIRTRVRSRRSWGSTRPRTRPRSSGTVVEQIDSLVRPVRGSGWQSSQLGDREVRRQLRLVRTVTACATGRPVRPGIRLRPRALLTGVAEPCGTLLTA
jgi:type I restriction enzyme R subunit